MWETRDTTEGKPTVWSGWKAAILRTLRRCRLGYHRGLTSRACIHRGNSGTWESQLSPYSGIRFKEYRRKGKLPEFGEKLQLPKRAPIRDTNKEEQTVRYRGRIAKSEQTREGHLAVLVDHSTDGR